MATPLLPAPFGKTTETSDRPILRTRTLLVTSGILALVGIGLQRMAPPEASPTSPRPGIDHHAALLDTTTTIVAQH